MGLLYINGRQQRIRVINCPVGFEQGLYSSKHLDMICRQMQCCMIRWYRLYFPGNNRIEPSFTCGPTFYTKISKSITQIVNAFLAFLPIIGEGCTGGEKTQLVMALRFV